MSLAGVGISLAATVLSAVFTAIVAQQYVRKRRPRSLLWSIGLGMFTLVAATQLLAEAGGWNDPLFRTWYVLGTSLVGFLGAGSVYVLDRRAGHAFSAYVLVLFVAFLAFAATAATNPEAIASYSAGSPPGGEGWAAGSAVRRFSPFFTIPGSVTLIGIALYGFVRFRLPYTIWIAAGAGVLAVGTGLARFGNPSLIYGAEFAGIALMFVGFWRASEWARARAKTVPGTPAAPAEAFEAPVVEAAPK